jgi:uncharacterized protein YigE (DUF2233 family)
VFKTILNPVTNPVILPLALVAGATSTLSQSDDDGDSACTHVRFEGEGFTLCQYDPKRHSLTLRVTRRNGQPLRHMAALAAELGEGTRRVRFAMNAGMYDVRGWPIGLYVERGRERHKVNTRTASGNFYLQPNGVFWVAGDGTAHVATTTTYLRGRDAPRFATQSGPMLVIDGKLHPKIAQDGASEWTRNGVGTGCVGATWFVISDGDISFGKFARVFRDALKCRDALFLDGAVSSLWDPRGGRMDMRHTLGPIILVRD